MSGTSRAQRKAAARRKAEARAEFRWREGQKRIAQHGRDLRKDASDANAERHRASEKVRSIYAKASTTAQQGVDAVRARYAAEEKALCTKAITSYTGATRFNTGGISVTHWNLGLPDDIAARLGASAGTRGGPLAVLTPDRRVVPSVNVMASADPELQGLPIFMDWARRSATVWRDEMIPFYLPLVKRLRDDDRWAGLAEQLGLTRKLGAEDQVNGKFGTYTRKRTIVQVPTLMRVHIGRTGLTLTYRHMPGDSAGTWQAEADALRAAFKAWGGPSGELRIGEDSAGNVVIFFNDRDPFVGEIKSGTFDTSRMRSLLGVTASGEPAWITWAGSSGLVVGGVPGSGKTASLIVVFAGMAGKADLYVFDGKAGFDLHPLRHIAKVYDRSGDTDAPLETLRELERARVERAEAMYSKLGANNFWNLSPEQRRKLGIRPVFVILDECQTWLDTSGMDKDEKASASEITKLVRTLIQKGRSAGIVVVLTTQKPDASTIPTVIRDNSALKICFRVSTPEQAITVLGRQAPDAPDPTQIPMSAKGRFVMETEGMGIILGQAGYTPPDVLDARLGGGDGPPDPIGPNGPDGGDPTDPPPARDVPEPESAASPAVSNSSTQPVEDGADWEPSPQFRAAGQLALTISPAVASAALTTILTGSGTDGLSPVAVALHALGMQLPPEEIGLLIGEVNRQPGSPTASEPQEPGRALRLVPPATETTEAERQAAEEPEPQITATHETTGGDDPLADMMDRLQGGSP